MSVTIGALRESAPRETRVSLVPEVTDKLIRDGAGRMVPAAVVSIGRNFCNWLAAISTAL